MGNNLTIKSAGLSQSAAQALIDASITAQNLAQYTTDAEVNALIDASITAQNLAQYTTDAEVNALIAASPGANPGEGHIFIDLQYQDISASGTWSWNADPSSYSHGHLFNTSHASGDYATFKTFLAAGTYTLKLMHAENTNYGIAKVLIDSVEVAAFDQYAVSAAYNIVKTQQNIVIATSGLKELKLLVNSKNAGSSNYYILFGLLSLFRTA